MSINLTRNKQIGANGELIWPMLVTFIQYLPGVKYGREYLCCGNIYARNNTSYLRLPSLLLGIYVPIHPVHFTTYHTYVVDPGALPHDLPSPSYCRRQRCLYVTNAAVPPSQEKKDQNKKNNTINTSYRRLKKIGAAMRAS